MFPWLLEQEYVAITCNLYLELDLGNYSTPALSACGSSHQYHSKMMLILGYLDIDCIVSCNTLSINCFCIKCLIIITKVMIMQNLSNLLCRSTVQMLLSVMDPDGVKRRRQNRLVRRVYQNK